MASAALMPNGPTKTLSFADVAQFGVKLADPFLTLPDKEKNRKRRRRRTKGIRKEKSSIFYDNAKNKVKTRPNHKQTVKTLPENQHKDKESLVDTAEKINDKDDISDKIKTAHDTMSEGTQVTDTEKHCSFLPSYK